MSVKNAEERRAMVGVVLSFCLFVALSINFAYAGGYALIFSLVSLSIPVLIFKGVRLGYIVARFVLGGLAVLLLGALTPFAYEDAVRAKIPYVYIVLGVAVGEALLLFLWWSLGEHVRLRNSKHGDGVSL